MKIFKSLEELFENGLKYYIHILNTDQRDKLNRASPINIYITIRCIQSLFEINDKYVDSYLDKIKRVTSIFVDLFKRKNVYNNSKSNNIGKTFDENYDILAGMDDNFTDENFESCKISYENLREYLIILLRIIATKFNSFPQDRDQINILEGIFLTIVENVPDLDIKNEALQLLKCLFLPKHKPKKHHFFIEPVKSKYFLFIKNH